MRRLGNPKYSRHFQKAPHYWEILSLFIDGEMQAAVSLAERVGFELPVRYLSRLSPLISAIIHANEQLSCSEMTGFRP